MNKDTKDIIPNLDYFLNLEFENNNDYVKNLVKETYEKQNTTQSLQDFLSSEKQILPDQNHNVVNQNNLIISYIIGIQQVQKYPSESTLNKEKQSLIPIKLLREAIKNSLYHSKDLFAIDCEDQNYLANSFYCIDPKNELFNYDFNQDQYKNIEKSKLLIDIESENEGDEKKVEDKQNTTQGNIKTANHIPKENSTIVLDSQPEIQLNNNNYQITNKQIASTEMTEQEISKEIVNKFNQIETSMSQMQQQQQLLKEVDASVAESGQIDKLQQDTTQLSNTLKIVGEIVSSTTNQDQTELKNQDKKENKIIDDDQQKDNKQSNNTMDDEQKNKQNEIGTINNDNNPQNENNVNIDSNNKQSKNTMDDEGQKSNDMIDEARNQNNNTNDQQKPITQDNKQENNKQDLNSQNKKQPDDEIVVEVVERQKVKEISQVASIQKQIEQQNNSSTLKSSNANETKKTKDKPNTSQTQTQPKEPESNSDSANNASQSNKYQISIEDIKSKQPTLQPLINKLDVSQNLFLPDPSAKCMTQEQCHAIINKEIFIVSKKHINPVLPNNFDYPNVTIKKQWLKKALLKLEKDKGIKLGFTMENCPDKLWMIQVLAQLDRQNELFFKLKQKMMNWGLKYTTETKGGARFDVIKKIKNQINIDETLFSKIPMIK